MENGYLIRGKGSEYNLPTQKYMDLKLFQIKETIINHGDGNVTVSKITKIIK
jgi:anti-repressor protein